MGAFLTYFSSLSEKPILKMSLLVICKILAVFVNTWLLMKSTIFGIVRICSSQLKCNYLEKKNVFLNFLFHFWNLHQFLNTTSKNMIVTTNTFPEFQTAKDVVRETSEKPRFRTTLDSQHIKGLQTPVKPAWQHFYHNSPSPWANLIWKLSLCVICQILGALVNTLTGDDKYPLRNWENLQLKVQVELYKKRKTFCHFFVSFLAFTSNFKDFERKMIVIANVFPTLQTVKEFVRPIPKKRCFRTLFASQHLKGFQTLLESVWEHFYHIFHHSEGNWFGKCLS